MRGVFEVRSAEPLRDRLVVLVDDVMTTGATASACAKALKHLPRADYVWTETEGQSWPSKAKPSLNRDASSS